MKTSTDDHRRHKLTFMVLLWSRRVDRQDAFCSEIVLVDKVIRLFEGKKSKIVVRTFYSKLSTVSPFVDYLAWCIPCTRCNRYSLRVVAIVMMQKASLHTIMQTCLVATGREEDVNIAQLFVDHQSQKTHHSGTALVQLNGSLLKLG